MDETTALVLAAVAVGLLGGAMVWRLRRRSQAVPASEAPARRLSSAQRLQGTLDATRRRLLLPIEAAMSRGRPEWPALREVMEEALIGADVGVPTAGRLLERLEARGGAPADVAALRRVLQEELAALLTASPPPEPGARPWVILVVGVNGVGKTTTIGKLAALHRGAGRRVLLVAADTFRAAALDQLAVWAERTGSDILRHGQGADPSAVVFDGLKASVARGVDVVLVDTAGRLHTRSPLMDELRKVRRVIEREVPGAPHETLLVVDATTGQNAVSQARHFTQTVAVTGLILTKLDGTARGGVIAALRQELGVPVHYVGVGEAVEDLRPFDAAEFARALLAAGPAEAD